jgi:L,D-peptidoglycan transpeptidase YkuD (ErfK/YbiS/YcfS/YnhG family)
MRRTPTALAAAALIAALLPVAATSAASATAAARTAPDSAVAAAAGAPVLGALTDARELAARTSPSSPASVAPHVPGAARYDGTLSSSVRQVIVVSAASWRSRTATLTLYNRVGARWARVATYPARLGYGGLVVGTRRVQDTGTTPAGSYAISEAFGRRTNPGTSLPYFHVTNDYWWVEDRNSVYYNNMRLGHLGGFLRRTTGFNASEQVATMGAQYDYAAVIDFNRPHPVVGRGAGIFLHAYGSGSTAGCVSIPGAAMRAVLQGLHRWTDPHILIGPGSWLAA